jgi:ribosomal protein S18 acetylase RimI-like enzyme
MITIRKAVPSDAPSIIDFQQKMAWETEGLKLADDVLSRGVNAVFGNSSLGQYWVADEEGKVISSLLITYEWSDWRNSQVWWIQSVYVLKPWRRMGIFRSMYLKIKEEAVRNEVAGLRLYVETNNSVAQDTYESLGMQCQHYKLYEWLKE